eukprot:SAG11_NODE_1399_length_5020_cov_3.398293_3_plen_181_part_00
MNLLSSNTVRVGASDYAILPYVSNRPEVLWGMEVVKNSTPAGMSSWVQRTMRSIDLYDHNGANLSQWPLWDAAPIDGSWAALGELGLAWRTEVGVMRWRADGWVALQSSSDGPPTHLPPTVMFALRFLSRLSAVETSQSRGSAKGALIAGWLVLRRRWMADDTADQDPKFGARNHDQCQM